MLEVDVCYEILIAAVACLLGLNIRRVFVGY